MPWLFKPTNKWRQYGYDVTIETFRQAKPLTDDYTVIRKHIAQFGVLLNQKDYFQFKAGITDALIFMNVDRFAFWMS